MTRLLFSRRSSFARASPTSRPSSLLRLVEIFQIRRLLSLLGGHQVAIRAHHKVLPVDADMRVALGATGLDPDRIVHPDVALVHRPRAGERMVDRGDVVM